MRRPEQRTIDDIASERRTAYVFLTLTAVFFGGTWVAGKLGVESIPPLTLAAFRFSLASLLLFGWVTRLPMRPQRATVRDLPLIVALGSTAVAGYNVLFLYGLKLAPASDGAIIVPGLAPVLTAALAWPVLNETMTAPREGVSRVGAARASAFAFLVPIFGVLSSVALLGERLSPLTLAGGLFVLSGLWLVQRTPAPPPSSERAAADAA